MKHKLIFFSSLLLASLVVQAIPPTSLKTEFLENSLGIDTAKPRFSWIVQDTMPGAKQTAYQLQAAVSPEFKEPLLWDSGRVASEQSHLVEYAGKPLVSRQQVWWRVKSWGKDGKDTGWSQPGRFEVGLLGTADWAGAEWISAPRFPGDESEVSARWFDAAVITTPWLSGVLSGGAIESARQDLAKTSGAAMLRKEFDLPGEAVRVRLYLSTLGFHEVTMNGRAVDDHRMETSPVHAPLFSYYVVKDVTELLKTGRNCLGLTLSNGRHVEGPRHHVVKDYGDRPATMVRLVADLADGSQVEVLSDASWKAAPGPIVRDSFWVGEAVDATRVRAGWNKAGFDDASWQPVEKADCVLPPKVIFQSFPSVRVVRRIKPVEMFNPAPGVWVFDMGEEIVGNAELRLRVPRGTVLTLRYASDIHGVYPDPFYRFRYSVSGYPPEVARRKGMLSPQGRGTVSHTRRLSRSANGSNDYYAVAPAVCTDVFRAAGGPEEVFERKFGYRPFRYVELTGYPGTPTLETVTGLSTHNDIAATGSFACSNPLLNEIEEASARTLRYLLQGMQLDNAGGEKGHYPSLLSLNYGIHAYRHDLSAFTARILNEVRDYSGLHDVIASRLKDAPPKGSVRVSVSESQLIYTELPWQFYLYHGDRLELETNYPLMRKSIGFWFENPKFPSLILDDGFGDHNGSTAAYDLPQYWKNPSSMAGCLVPHAVPKDFYGTTTGLKVTGTTLQAARILNRDDDAAQLEKLRVEIRTAARDKFRDPTSGVYCAGAPTMQGVNALAVWSGLADRSEYGPLVDGIVEDMREKWNGHISTGARASYPLLAVLTQNGRVDDAYAIMTRTNYPSLGHMLSFGSKTLAEAWAFPAFPNDAARTQGELAPMTTWFYEWLCGVKPDPALPGFKHFFITPHFPKDLASAGMEFRSPYGNIATWWEQKKGTVTLKARVPWNTTATVKLPGFTKITINAKPEEQSVFNLPAGEWEIIANQNKERK